MDPRALGAGWAALLTTLVGIFPYVCRKSRVTALFAASNVSLAIWNLADIAVFLPADHSTKLLLFRLSYILGVLVVLFFYRFMTCFARFSDAAVQRAWKPLLFAALVLWAASPTPWLIAGLDIQPNGFHERPGPLYPFFILFTLVGLGLPQYWLFATYSRTEEALRGQLRYLILALACGFVAVILFFVTLYDHRVPAYVYYAFQVLYSVIVAYAILARRLMDITVVIRKTLVYSAVTAALTAVYFAVLIVLARGLEGWAGDPGIYSSAGAAAVIALLFHPLRVRVQRWIDRHFPRERLNQELLQEAAGGFAHEMKRPLSKISLPAELALRDLDAVEKGEKSWDQVLPGLRQRLQFIIGQSVDAGYKIEAIRELSSAEAAPLAAVDIGALVRKALDDERDRLADRGINVRVDLPADLPRAAGRARQLEIILVNLIKNAAEAMTGGAGRDLRISAAREGATVRLRLSDSGPGIAPEQRARIFDPRFTTKNRQGMGIGLYLARQLAQSAGARLELAPATASGAEFVLHLPVHGDGERD